MLKHVLLQILKKFLKKILATEYDMVYTVP